MVASKSQVSLTHEETRQGIPEALCLYGISKATVFLSRARARACVCVCVASSLRQ